MCWQWSGILILIVVQYVIFFIVNKLGENSLLIYDDDDGLGEYEYLICM